MLKTKVIEVSGYKLTSRAHIPKAYMSTFTVTGLEPAHSLHYQGVSVSMLPGTYDKLYKCSDQRNFCISLYQKCQ